MVTLHLWLCFLTLQNDRDTLRVKGKIVDDLTQTVQQLKQVIISLLLVWPR